MNRLVATALFDPGQGSFFAGADPRTGESWRVHGGVPGDRVVLAPRDEDPGWAGIARILEPGPGRRPAACPLAGECGGCPWMQIEAGRQRALRRARLTARFRDLGLGLPEDGVASIFAASEVRYRYRARFQCAFENRGGRIGFHRTGARDLLDVADCPVLAPRLQAAYSLLRGLLLEIHPRDLTGFELTLLPEAAGGLLYLNPRDRAPLDWPRLGELLLEGAAGALAGVAVRLPAHDARPEILGPPFIRGRTPGGQPVATPARGFLQAHLEAADRLVETVVRLAGAGPGMRIAELYAGSGLLGWGLAAAGAEVRAWELDRQAVAAAQSLPAPPRGTLRLEWGNAGAWPLAGSAGNEEVWVADPPRSGLGGAARTWAASGPEVLVLVSCHFPALAGDARELRRGGYRLQGLAQVDMFPQTPFTETVLRLVRG